MAGKLEGMFSKIPLREAYKTTMEYERHLYDLRNQGADPRGRKKIDVKYKKLVNEAINYSMQFSEGELLALIGYSLLGGSIEDEAIACSLVGKVIKEKKKP